MLDPVVILCGGRGTRLSERTESIPKALVEIGGRPILWHVISIYIAQGFTRFLLLTGYKGERIGSWVESTPWPERVEVSCIDTGLDTPTGGRLKAAEDHIGERAFSTTYADGVADIDLAALAGVHREAGRLATMTVVRPELQFGIADLDDHGLVRGFHEKPQVENAASAASPASVDPIALLARQIEAGAVTPQQAIEQVVHLILNEEGAAALPPAVRAEVRAALESLVEDDPYLAELLAGIGAR